LGFKPIKDCLLNSAKKTPANKKRLPMNRSGGISLTASLENIQLMAARRVTMMSSTSALRELLDKVITTYQMKKVLHNTD